MFILLAYLIIIYVQYKEICSQNVWQWLHFSYLNGTFMFNITEKCISKSWNSFIGFCSISRYIPNHFCSMFHITTAKNIRSSMYSSYFDHASVSNRNHTYKNRVNTFFLAHSFQASAICWNLG